MSRSRAIPAEGRVTGNTHLIDGEGGLGRSAWSTPWASHHVPVAITTPSQPSIIRNSPLSRYWFRGCLVVCGALLVLYAGALAFLVGATFFVERSHSAGDVLAEVAVGFAILSASFLACLALVRTRATITAGMPIVVRNWYRTYVIDPAQIVSVEIGQGFISPFHQAVLIHLSTGKTVKVFASDRLLGRRRELPSLVTEFEATRQLPGQIGEW